MLLPVTAGEQMLGNPAAVTVRASLIAAARVTNVVRAVDARCDNKLMIRGVDVNIPCVIRGVDIHPISPY